MKKYLAVLFIVITTIYASTDEAGQDFAFLDLGVGARPLAMGGAFTAIADDANAPYWNPAGMSQLQRAEFTTMQSKLSTDADYYYASYAHPGDIGWGISWVQIKLKDIVETAASLNGHDVVSLGNFDYTADAVILALSKQLDSSLSLGLGIKGINYKMGVTDGNGRGYSMSPSLLYKPSEYFVFGLQLRDMNNLITWDTGLNEKVPATMQAGVAVMISPKLTYALEGEQKQADLHSIFVHQGFEYRPAEEIALRFGNDRSRFSAGIGIYMNNFALDYAFVGKESNGLGDESRVSLGVNF